jgi:hypothetical protein
MPLEQAQKSPVAGSFNEPQNPWDDELVEGPDSRQLPLSLKAGTVSQAQEGAKEDSRPGISRVPQILMAGTARRQAAEEFQRNQGSDGYAPETQWETSTSPRLQSNNPFLRTRNPSPNPWEGGNQPSQPQGPPEQSAWAPRVHQETSNERISQGKPSISSTDKCCLTSFSFRVHSYDSPFVIIGSTGGPVDSAERSIRHADTSSTDRDGCATQPSRH